MRIVAGEFRGRTITAPSGESTRPTTDRVREALFSSLYSLLGGFEGAAVLDAFAGSGALGLEALSRGAGSAVFFENDRKATRELERNVERCGLGASRARIVARDFLAQAKVPGGPFDIVFLDPPYAYDPRTVLEAISRLRSEGTVAEGCTVVYEHDVKSSGPVAEAAQHCGLSVVSCKKYGKTSVTTLRA